MIEVIRKGGEIRIVDMGRYGYREYGVPISGAMDLRSAARANSLLHNPVSFAVLELTSPGHELNFMHDTTIGITGAEGNIRVNSNKIYTDNVYQISGHSRLTIGTLSKGYRLYIAVQGGIKSSTILGSQSPIPGLLNRSLRKGDRVELSRSDLYPSISSSITALHIETKRKLGCYPGPEWFHLDRHNQSALLDNAYYIDNKSNRMGYRLNGIPIISDIVEIFSSSVMPGTVQLLPNGLPLILMRDCQTTGGYPRILQVCEEDINQLAQRRVGNQVQFSLLIE